MASVSFLTQSFLGVLQYFTNINANVTSPRGVLQNEYPSRSEDVPEILKLSFTVPDLGAVEQRW